MAPTQARNKNVMRAMKYRVSIRFRIEFDLLAHRLSLQAQGERRRAVGFCFASIFWQISLACCGQHRATLFASFSMKYEIIGGTTSRGPEKLLRASRVSVAGGRRRGQCRFVRIAICSIDGAGRNLTAEPLEQSFGLGMVGEAVNGDRECRVGQDLNRVAGLQVSLARSGDAGELPDGHGIVDEGIVHPL